MGGKTHLLSAPRNAKAIAQLGSNKNPRPTACRTGIGLSQNVPHRRVAAPAA